MKDLRNPLSSYFSRNELPGCNLVSNAVALTFYHHCRPGWTHLERWTCATCSPRTLQQTSCQHQPENRFSLDELSCKLFLISVQAGLDSLGAVDLRNLLSSHCATDELPATLAFDYPTTAALAQLLLSLQPQATVVQVQVA